MDGFRYGVVLHKQKNENLAQEMFIRSVREYPYNWAAWEELRGCINSFEDVSRFISILCLIYADQNSA